MERSGDTAPSVHEFDDLRQLVLREGPFVTVWVTRPSTVTADITTAVRSVQDQAGQHLSDEVASALAERVDGAFPDAAGAVAVADSDGVQFFEALPAPPRTDLVRVGALPSVAPVIEHRQSAIPFMLLVMDRRGADLYWSGDGRTGSTTVEGDDTFLTKVHAGGWAQKQFQRRAENTWEQTADEIVAELAQRADRVKPRIIAVAGDVRMLEMFRKKVPASIDAMLRDVSGSRSADGSDDDRQAQLQRWIRTAIAEDTVTALQLFDQELGQADRAVTGTADVLAALCEARVDTLLVHDDPDAPGIAYFVPDEPTLAAADPQTLMAIGRSDPRSARLIDVAVRAAMHTDAGIRIVPTTPRLADGLGAILRW